MPFPVSLSLSPRAHSRYRGPACAGDRVGGKWTPELAHSRCSSNGNCGHRQENHFPKAPEARHTALPPNAVSRAPRSWGTWRGGESLEKPTHGLVTEAHPGQHPRRQLPLLSQLFEPYAPVKPRLSSCGPLGLEAFSSWIEPQPTSVSTQPGTQRLSLSEILARGPQRIC